MSIRSATFEDRGSLNALLNELHEELPTYFSDVNDMLDILKEKNTKVYLIEDERKEVFGFSVLQENEEKAEILMVYVRRNERGKGYGYKLTEAAVKATKNKKIVAYVDPRNKEMKKILSKLGFRLESEGDEDYGRYKDVYALEVK
jgi:RimJ/RimL family protein N-acetyltransferase